MNTTTRTDQEATEVTIPCGWCDEPVQVTDDHGQVVYCSEAHQQANVYVPGFGI